MLIFSENRLVPTEVNMLTIKAKDDSGYFYIHRLLYDQAVIISDIYGDDYMSLIKEITGSPISRNDADYFYETAPAPINILGAFLLLVNEEIIDFVDMVGAIHVMSGPIHLRNMLKVPFMIRNTPITFSLSIREEYQLAWDNFFQNTPLYDSSRFITGNATPMNGVATSTNTEEYEESAEEEEELTGYEEYGIGASEMSVLFGDDDIFSDMDEELSDMDSDPFSNLTSEDENTEEEPELEPVVKEEPKKKSLIDEMLSL